MANADTGNGATITFGTSGFTASIRELGGSEETREWLEKSHLGTTGYKEYTPTDLVEPGEFTGMFFFDSLLNSLPDISAAPETVTITFPVTTGGSTGATLAGTGGFSRRKWPDVRNGELMMGEFTVKWDGGTGPTHTVGS